MACDDLITNQDLENAKKDATTMSDFVESDSPEIQSKNGKNIRTLQGINDAADNLISSLGGTDIGDYEDDLTLNSYNEYVVFDRAGATTGPSLWKAIPPRTPAPGTPLPYTIDSATYPDPTSDPNIEPFSDINKAGAEQIAQEEANAGDSQLAGGNIWPLSSQESAQVGDILPVGTSFVRLSGVLYELSEAVSSPESILTIDTTPDFGKNITLSDLSTRFLFNSKYNIEDIRKYGATESLDMGDAINFAIQFTSSLTIPPWNGPWNVPVDLSGTSTRYSIKGFGLDQTKFIVSTSTGDIKLKVTGQGHDIGPFSFTTNDATMKDYTAFQGGNQTESTSFTRSNLDIKASYATNGVEVRGWINNLNIFTTFCQRGFKGRENNDGKLNLRSENDTRAWDIEEIFGSELSLLIENLFTTESTVASTIDNFQGLNVKHLYVEGGRFDSEIVRFAPVTQSYGLTVNALSTVITPINGLPGITFEKIEGVETNGYISTGTNRNAVEYTQDCKGVVNGLIGRSSTPSSNDSTNYMQDLSSQVRRAENWVGDSHFDHQLNTWDILTQTNTTWSLETSNIRTGRYGIKASATPGTNLNEFQIKRSVNLFPNITEVAGRSIKAFAWIFVPSIPEFENRTLLPSFGINVQGSNPAFSVQQLTLTPGTWNLVESTSLNVPSGFGSLPTDTLGLVFFVNQTTNNAVSGAEVIIDSVYITDSSVSMVDISNGNYRDYNLMGVKSDGVNMEITSQQYHAASIPHTNIRRGDVVKRLEPTPGGKFGVVATQGGVMDGNTGSNAVFKFYGQIDA